MLRAEREDFIIGEAAIAPGTQRTVDLNVSMLSNHMPMTMPVRVVHGEEPGPVLFLSGAMHGDEITGVEIIRRVLKDDALQSIAGTLLAVPIVNSLGFLSQSRYLPDGRDLNRCFPGSDRGSLASILADLFLREVVLRAQYGIDLHSAGAHRINLPQVRIAPEQPELLELAQGGPLRLADRLARGFHLQGLGLGHRRAPPFLRLTLRGWEGLAGSVAGSGATAGATSLGGVREERFSGAAGRGIRRRVTRPWPTVHRLVVIQ